MQNIKDLFGIQNFNVLQDEKNYYFFRALNNGDSSDIKNNLITDKNGKIVRIRTDRSRYIENNNCNFVKYTEKEKISLEQVIDHIKINHRLDTNCISLSNNANVSIMYGRNFYSDTYVLIIISKSEMDTTVINAGEYRLQEINKKIEYTVQKLSNESFKKNNKNILLSLQQIDSSNSVELYNIIQNMYKLNLKKIANFTGKHVNFENKIYLKNLYGNYNSLDSKQTLTKNKIIAKLTLLEHTKVMKPILKNMLTNVIILDTIGRAFSSNEFIYYGEIPKEKIMEVSSKFIDLIALLQQK